MNKTRIENLKHLANKGFKVAENFAMARQKNGSSAILRPAEEIVGRLLALKALWLWVDDHPSAEPEVIVTEMLHSHDLKSHLTTAENKILNLSRKDACQQYGHLTGWKNENCWALAWVLGFPDAPLVDVGQVSGDFGRRLMLSWLPDNAIECRQLKSNIQLRSAVEVSELEDLFYCAHNAVRSVKLGSGAMPTELDATILGGCIHERHHALTWALSPEVDWDDTDLSV